MARIGNVFFVCVLCLALTILLWRVVIPDHMRSLWEHAFPRVDKGLKIGEKDDEAAARKRRKLHKSLLAKAKIIIAAWQIAASTDMVQFSSSADFSLISSDNTGYFASSLSTDLCESHGALQCAWTRKRTVSKMSSEFAVK